MYSNSDQEEPGNTSLTKLQIGVLACAVCTVIVVGATAMTSEGQESRPSDNLLENSQTLSLID